MKKSGFTLAEVLITLGIIGVVAAMTAPQLLQDSQNKIAASRLSVISSNLENAFTSAMATEGVDDISRTSIFRSADKNSFAGNLGRYMNIAGIATDPNVQNMTSDTFYVNGPYTLRGGDLGDFCRAEDNGSTSEFFPIMLKNGAAIHVLFRHGDNAAGEQYNSSRIQNRDNIIAAGGSLVESKAEIVIDVNGKEKPNRAGRDLFKYEVGSNGILYPIGGRDYALFMSSPEDAAGAVSDTNMWNNAAAGMYTRCTNGRDEPENENSPESLGTGFGCTARVIDEGFNIDY